MDDIKSLAEYLRMQGGDEDTILAHINPTEAEWLKDMGGSGEINPVTGLPQYGFGNILGPLAGFLGGSMIGAPTLGAILGGGLGGSKKKKKKKDEESEEPGFLSKLSSKSSDFFSDPMNLLSVGSAAANILSRPKKERKLSRGEEGAAELEYLLASELPPEHLANRKKRYEKASRLTNDEIRELMQYKQALERAEWEARNNLQPGETLNFDPIYRKDNDEDEFKKTGRWFEYYNDPEFQGKRVYMKKGGHLDDGYATMEIAIEPMTHKQNSLSSILKHLFSDDDLDDCCDHDDEGYCHKHNDYCDSNNHFTGFVNSDDGGQDDTIDAKLSGGEYVIDADTVAQIGDGNSKNGAKKLDDLVKRIREYKRSSDYDDIPPSLAYRD